MFCALYAQEDLSEDVEKHRSEYRVPALAVATYHKGALVSSGCAGVRKIGSPEKVTIHDKYHIGSGTKSMTALLAAMLVDEGKLSWNLDVQSAFLGLETHQAYQAATLQQFLTHTAGTPAKLDKDYLWRLRQSVLRSSIQRQKFVTKMLSEAPQATPGTEFIYSNTGYVVAGVMLEKYGGKVYEALLHEKVFKPLSLSSAGFRAPAKNGEVNQPYGHKANYGKVFPVNPEPLGDNPASLAPATSVHMSVLDYAKYASFYAQKRQSLVSEESRQALWQPTQHRQYAMGWRIRGSKYGRIYQHEGTNKSFFALQVVIPDQEFAAVAKTSSGTEDGLEACEKIIEKLLAKYV